MNWIQFLFTLDKPLPNTQTTNLNVLSENWVEVEYDFEFENKFEPAIKISDNRQINIVVPYQIKPDSVLTRLVYYNCEIKILNPKNIYALNNITQYTKYLSQII